MRRNLGDHPAGDGRRGAHDGSEYRGVHPTSVPAERIPWQRPWSTALALSLNRGLEATDLIDDAYTTLERQLASPEGDSVSSPPSRTVPAPRR